MIEWTSLPFMIGGKKNYVAIGVPVVTWVMVLLFWGVWWFILSFVLVGASILPYFIPTKYRLTDRGIAVRSMFTKKDKKWEEYKSYSVDKHGVFLSPFSRPSRLENFRGLYLRFHNNGEEIVAFVKKIMEKS